MPLLAIPLAALIGLSLGLLGGGGSILTAPILVYALGFTAKQGIAMSLAVVGTTSAFGAWSHWRAGNLQVRVALTFAAVAMVGTFGGARVAAHIPGTVQLALFGAVMLVAALFMFRSRPSAPSPSPTEAASAKVNLLALVPVSLGVGALTGLVGVGGGFLIVPALVLLTGLSMKHAVGTSLLVIALNAFVGFAGYLGQVEVPWPVLGLFTSVAVAGVLGGTMLARSFSHGALRRGFAVLLVLMGCFVLYQNRAVFLPAVPVSAP